MKSQMFHILFIASVILWAGCARTGPQKSLSKASTDELIRLLEDTKDSSGLFPDIIMELTARGPTAYEAAPTLARALAYDRRDSTIASRALIAMGPTAKSAIPFLIVNLRDQRADVRRYSVFVLGTMGNPSHCAIPQLAPLLWDQDPGVRSAAAASIQAITGHDLVESTQELDPTLPGSVFLDEPEGNISGKARAWWLQTGQALNWHPEDCKE